MDETIHRIIILTCKGCREILAEISAGTGIKLSLSQKINRAIHALNDVIGEVGK